MRNLTISILSLVFVTPSLASGWLCTKTASVKNENEILACGVGVSSEESLARVKALKAAKEEFSTLCSISFDCKGKKKIATPMRNSCKKISKNKYKCWRGLKVKWEEVKDEFKNAQSLDPYIILQVGASTSPISELSGYFSSSLTKGVELTYIPSRERLNGFQINFSAEFDFFNEEYAIDSTTGEVSAQMASLKTNFSFFNSRSYFGPHLGISQTTLSSESQNLPSQRDELDFSAQSLILGAHAGWLVPLSKSLKGSIKLEAEYQLFSKKQTSSSYFISNPDIKSNVAIAIKVGIPIKLD